MSFGNIVQPARPIKINLDVAVDEYKYEVDCHVWKFTAADDANQSIDVKFNDSTSEWVTMFVGGGFSHFPIKTFWVRHNANVGKRAFIQVAGRADLADPSKFEVFASESAGNVSVTNTKDSPVPVEPVGKNFQTEDGPIDLAGSATRVVIEDTETAGDDKVIYTVGTGRRLDITGGELSGASSAVVQVVDGSGNQRWIDVAGTLAHRIRPMSLTPGMSVLLRTQEAAQAARLLLAGSLVITDGSAGYVTMTTDPAWVGTGGASNVLAFVAASAMPAEMLAVIRADGGDVRFYEAGTTTQLPRACVVMAGVCVGWYVLFDSLSDSEGDAFDVRYNGIDQDHAVDGTYGRNAACGIGGTCKMFMPMVSDPSGTGPQFTDWTGNGNDGTASGTMTTADIVDGVRHKAIEFDGVDDKVQISTTVLQETSIATVMIRMFPTSYVGEYDRHILGDGGDIFRLSMHDATSCYFSFGGSGLGVGTINLAEWADIALVIDGTNAKTYTAGSQSDTMAYAGTIGNTSPLTIGQAPSITPHQSPFSGKIELVRIDSVGRDAAYMQTTYNADRHAGDFWASIVYH